jgi:hypothetical protein
MASVHEIAVKLTAHTGNVQTSLDKVKERIDSLTEARKRMGFMDRLEAQRTDDRIARLKRLREELVKQGATEQAVATSRGGRSGGTDRFGDNAHNEALKGNGRLAQSFTQLSYAVEDFLAVYGTMGFQGAMRGAGNNLSMVARILAGPFAGGIMGAAIVGLPLFIAATRTAKQEQEEFAKALKKSAEAGDDWFKLQQKFAMDRLDQKFTMEDLLDIKSPDEAESKLKDISRNMEKLSESYDQAGDSIDRAMKKVLDVVAGGGAGRRGFDPIFDKAQERFEVLRKNFETDFKNNFRLDPTSAIETLTKDLTTLMGELPNIRLPIAMNEFSDIDPQEMELALKQQAERKQLLADIEASIAKAKAAAELANANAEEIKRLEQERLKIQQQRNDLLDQEKLLQQEIKDAIREMTRAQGQEAFARAIQSPFQQIIQGVADDIQKLEDMMVMSGGTPTQQTAFLNARDNLVAKAVDDLKGTTKEQTQVFKDAMVSGPNSNEAVEAAKRAAEAQVEAAKNQKKDATNSDVVRAIDFLTQSLKDGKLIAVPVGP